MIILIFLGIFVSVFFISTEIILRSLTVWIGDTKTIANRYVEMLLITFSTYPENIFKTGIKVLLYTVIPVAYLAYLPSNIMYQFNILDLLCVLLAGGIYLALAIFVFYKAIKNYESGNNMSMKGWKNKCVINLIFNNALIFLYCNENNIFAIKYY